MIYLNLDCLPEIRKYKDNHFDIGVVDPNWGIGESSKNHNSRNTPVIQKNGKRLKIANKDYKRKNWDKVNGNNHYSDCEIAWTNLFSSTRIFRYMWNGMMQGKSMHEGTIQQGNKKLNEKRIHPTQKPVRLYLWIATKFFKENWLVLDTHAGSASSLIAYERLGFEYVGYEKDKDHYNDSVERLFLWRLNNTEHCENLFNGTFY